jgi:hypothetical protein
MKTKCFIGTLATGVVALAALLWGCEQEPEAVSVSVGQVTVSLALKGEDPLKKADAAPAAGALLTVYPGSDEIAAITRYVLTFEPTGGGAEAHAAVDVAAPATEATVSLVVGTYNITVTAMKNDTVVAVGTAPVNVTADVNEPAAVDMKPATGEGAANGTFRYNITLPAGASGSLTLTASGGGAVEGGTKDLTTGENTDTVGLAAGEYRLALDLSRGNESAGFGNEVVYIYSGLTSAFVREFTDSHFVAAEEGESLGLTISFGAETIPLSESGTLSFVQGGTPFTLTVTDTEFSDVNWYLDNAPEPAATGATYTPAADLSVKKHFLTVTAVKNGSTYSELIEFTVTAAAGGGGGPVTVESVSASELAAYLAAIPENEGDTADNPYMVKLDSTVNITGDDWGTTIKNALATNTKYITLDLSACTATDNTIAGNSSNPSGNNFNIVNSSYIAGIIFPDSLTSVGRYACVNWTTLKTVTIPNGLTSTDTSAFMGCTSLSIISLPEGFLTLQASTFKGCTALSSITLPSTLTTMGSSVFDGCNLSTITIPAGVSELDANAFANCTNLVSATLLKSDGIVTLYNKSAFANNTHANLEIFVPSNLVSSYKEADNWKKSELIDRIKPIEN